MPYPSERASRLGHVPVVNSQAVQEAFSRWEVAQATPADENRVSSLCRPVEDLENPGVSDAVRFAITVDGSDTEVEATANGPRSAEMPAWVGAGPRHQDGSAEAGIDRATSVASARASAARARVSRRGVGTVDLPEECRGHR